MPKATRPDDKRLSPHKLTKLLTLRCTEADIDIAAVAANRLGYDSTSEALRDLMTFIAGADESIVHAIKVRL